MQPDRPAPADTDAEYLPPHVYANWLALAVRVAEEAPDRDAWRRWAEERLRPRVQAAAAIETPTAARHARRIGHMEDAEPASHWIDERRQRAHASRQPRGDRRQNCGDD